MLAVVRGIRDPSASGAPEPDRSRWKRGASIEDVNRSLEQELERVRARKPDSAKTGRAPARKPFAALPLALALLAGPASAQRDPGCTREAFESAVGQSAAALRDLTGQNRPLFQSRLRALKDKRGWGHDEFLREAAPIVQDQRTEAFDKESSTLLETIQRMGAEGSAAPTPDCAALAKLKDAMQALVDAQRGKWAYLIEKVERELGQ